MSFRFVVETIPSSKFSYASLIISLISVLENKSRRNFSNILNAIILKSLFLRFAISTLVNEGNSLGTKSPPSGAKPKFRTSSEVKILS